MLPDSWETKQIIDVCELIVDCVNKTAPTTSFATPYKMVRTSNIRDGKLNLNDVKYVDIDTYNTWTRRAKVEKEDVLLTREAPVGEVAFVDTEDTIFLGQRIMQYRANPELLNSKFLLYCFLSPELQKQFAQFGDIGSTVSHIRVGDCYKFQISLPPLAEQRKIAEILSTWDEAIDLTAQLIAAKQRRNQALMQRLLTGKVRFPGFDGEWSRDKLQNITAIDYGKSPSEIRDDNGCFNIWGTGGLVGKTNVALCSSPAVIIGRKGTIDKPILTEEPFWTIDTTFYCLPKPTTNVRWLYYALSHIDLKQYNEASGVPSLSRSTLYNVHLQVPPMAEQCQIAELLLICDQELDLLQEKLAALRQQKQGLMQQLLTGKIRVKV